MYVDNKSTKWSPGLTVYECANNRTSVQQCALNISLSIKIYFLSDNNNKNFNTACERSKGCRRSNTLIKLAA